MKKKKKVLFTFDYELFLGKSSGTVDKCLIEPTREIISLLEKFNYKAVFFVDTIYLIRLKQIANESAKKDYIKIADQIQLLAKKGHYVFPHIHPHWLDAKYDEQTNQWNLSDISKYRFHAISLQVRETIFKDSLDLLKEILLPVDPLYALDGFRAGGWSIQPFEDFKPFFDKYGIKYDFSVLPDSHFESTAQYYDFRNTPSEKPYRFSGELLKEDPAGEHMEFPISKARIKPAVSLLDKIKYKLLPASEKQTAQGYSVDALNVGIKSLKKVKEMFSMDVLTAVKLPSYFHFIDRTNYMHFISHPKMINRHGLFNFEKFLKIAGSRYALETDFKKMIY